MKTKSETRKRKTRRKTKSEKRRKMRKKMMTTMREVTTKKMTMKKTKKRIPRLPAALQDAVYCPRCGCLSPHRSCQCRPALAFPRTVPSEGASSDADLPGRPPHTCICGYPF
jgi:hypothetical protein